MNTSINPSQEDNRIPLRSTEDLEIATQAVPLNNRVNAGETKSKEEREKEREKKQRKRLWKKICDLDYYSLFKLFGPIIPTLPSIYAIVASMFEDTSNSSLSNWYKIFEFMENLNICLYSIAATVFYKIFQSAKKANDPERKKKNKAGKKKKKPKNQVQMKYAEDVRKLNTIFLVFCFIVSAVKLVLGILLAPLDKVPDDQPKGLFYFYLFSKIGLIIAQLFYLWTVYVKKYYKSEEEIDDLADNGTVDGSNKKKNDDDPDKKDEDKEEKKEEEKKEEKKPKENGKSKQDQENFEKVLHTMEENNKFNEKLLSRLEDMDELNQNWTEVKKELSMIKRQNLVLLKFSKPLAEDVELKILNQTDKTVENQSFVINAKIYESVKDVKQKIAEKLSLGKTVKVDLKTSQGELKDDGLIGEFDLDRLKQGLLLNYYEGN